MEHELKANSSSQISRPSSKINSSRKGGLKEEVKEEGSEPGCKINFHEGKPAKPFSVLYFHRFESTIAGQFFGHTHKDEFEIFYDDTDQKRATR